jgi:hypothetical protein
VVGDALITGNVSDLNIVSNVNMLHTSNTAALKLNSNVVTEFPRSKKLIKYPRVAMTGPSAPTGYVVSASTALGSGWEPYRAFNTIAGEEEGWHDEGSTYSTGVYIGSNSVTPVTGSAVEGEWIQIQLPEKIKLEKIRLAPRTTYNFRMPKDATILGSINGTDWYRVTSWSGQTYLSGNNYATIDVDSEQYYNYYVLVVESLDAAGNSVNIGEWELFGVPEYDPEAHGTDVVVKSYPNVPNTDWLEVYYDAKDYTSGVVQDLSTNSFNGTLTNGASYNNSDGIDKFVFDAGLNQYMTTTTNISGSAFIHTTSMWVKFVEVSTVSSDQHYLFMLGAFGSNSIGMYYSANQGIRVAPSGFDYRSQYHPVAGKWFHVSYTYAGGAHGTAAMNTTVKFYINGKQWIIPAYYGSTSTVTLPSSSVLQINGSAGNNNTLMDMEVANFRLFNRALTQDEIYQLYAYQKEYFGHGDLSMTLKAGRLGIGTSEPRAALDVRGSVLINGQLFGSGSMSGGNDIFDIDGYRVHVFTTSGNLWVLSNDLNVDVLLVAGGGGGGQDNAGGGGAGGLIFKPGHRLQVGGYTVIIGSGGSGCIHQNNGPEAKVGGNTEIKRLSNGSGDLVAYGGGAGMNGGSEQAAERNGGSGGGGASEGSFLTGGGTATQTGTYNYGNNGGNGVSDAGGGGGGAGLAGQNGSTDGAGYGGIGGDGLSGVTGYDFAEIFGTRYGELIGEDVWFAGGGAGANINYGSNNTAGGSFRRGGKGGGGGGPILSDRSVEVTSGLPNTGGGGNGAGWFAGTPYNISYELHGGDGGSGIVIFRYKL